MDSQGSVVRLAVAEEDDPHSTVFILLSAAAASSCITVSAPAAWLSRVPYLAARLSEPWIKSSSSQQHITLECAPGSTPHSYLQCLRLLSSSPSRWPPLFESVNEVLQILPVADYLLFEECWDACMRFLASTPWSFDEEDAIRTTISKLNMEPSPDVKERLDTSHDGAVLQTFLHGMLLTPSHETFLGTWCEKWLNPSSAPSAENLHAMLLKVMRSLENTGWTLPRLWFVLAKCLLQFADAQQFIWQLLNSEDLLKRLAYPLSENKEDSYVIFKHVLEKVEKRVVLLSNVQRARLVHWSRLGTPPNKEEASYYDNMRLRLAETLPINDAAQLNAMGDIFHNVVLQWIDRIAYRVSQMDKAGLEAFCENV